MTRARLNLMALVAVATLVVAACGGSDSETSTGESPETTSGGSGVTTPDVRVGGGFDGSLEACSDLVNAFLIVAAGPMMGFVAGSDAADFEEALAELDARVPSELADEFAIIEAAFAEFNAALGGASMSDLMNDPTVSDRLEEAGESLDDSEVQEAIETMAQFLEDNCSEFGFSDLTR